MLTVQAIQQSLPLTQVLDERGWFVLPRTGTPLSDLVNSSIDGMTVFGATDGGKDYNIDAETLAAMSAVKQDGEERSIHDLIMDKLTEVSVEGVTEHLRMARNVVKPVVVELVEAAARRAAQINPSKILGMEVIVLERPAVWSNNSFAGMLKNYDQVPVQDPKLVLNCPELDAGAIVDLMKPGVGSLDSDIAEWVSAKGDAIFLEVWNTIFRITQIAPNAPSVSLQAMLRNPFTGADYATAVFLLARNLYEKHDPLPGTEMSLTAYESALVEIRDQAAGALYRFLTMEENNMRNGVLVHSYTDRTITVHQAVYRKWLADGGSNEVLFGNLVQAPVMTGVRQLNESAQRLLDGWERTAATLAATERNQRYVAMRRILREEYLAQINALTDVERQTLGGVQRVMNLVDIQLDTMRNADVDNLYGFCLRLVCRTRFPNSSAERILEGMVEQHEPNPDLNPREAAAVATLEYIFDWVATMMELR